ncbi:ferredoxin [Spirillospora sp. NPDC029432]|uniref:ferredoxin n=1 Tax=Spirillospora sp. NPDC029432 TaxID=3154599 RepID=UPI00345554F1
MNTGADWTIEVDRSVCIGNKMCVSVAPDAFEMAEGKARARTENVSPSESVADAYESCPVSVIVVRDATGEEIEPGN